MPSIGRRELLVSSFNDSVIAWSELNLQPSVPHGHLQHWAICPVTICETCKEDNENRKSKTCYILNYDFWLLLFSILIRKKLLVIIYKCLMQIEQTLITGLLILVYTVFIGQNKSLSYIQWVIHPSQILIKGWSIVLTNHYALWQTNFSLIWYSFVSITYNKLKMPENMILPLMILPLILLDLKG